MVRTVRRAAQRNEYSAHPSGLIDTHNCPTNNGHFPLSLFPFSLFAVTFIESSNNVTFLLSCLSVVFTCPIPNIGTGWSASKQDIWIPLLNYSGDISPSQSLHSSHYVMSSELKVEIVFGLLATLIGVLAIYISIRQYHVSTRPRRECQSWKSRLERQLECVC